MKFAPLYRILLLAALALVLLPGDAPAKDGKALMLTVFGTSTGASVTFDEILPLVRERFPERQIFIPYTSGIIRNKLNAEISDPALKILSPDEMLQKLAAEGFTDIAVISTLVFPGVEHEKLEASVDDFKAANSRVRVSYLPPLLSDRANLFPAVNCLGKYMIKNGLNVVVSHGTHEGHEVENVYLELAESVAETYPNARVGSIEGLPDMEETLRWVESNPDKNVRFVVFMFVAGDHAENDIASDEEDSLFTAVKEMGKTPSVYLTETENGQRIVSLGLDPEYRQILLDYYLNNVAQ